MNYPVWYLPDVGGGLLIAVIAILHVFVSHFAVGGGLYLIYAEKKGLREKSQEILDFTKNHARFFLLVTMVFGSITGVGIWFIIALVNPAATSYLIHTFVFGWAAEWVFFIVEITAAFIYYYMFGRMDSKTHLRIGWIYFISAWMSLFLINGIICFMLTPGDWLSNQNFWIGFFNPSFFPSLIFRTFIALLMAGIYGFLSSSFVQSDNLKETMTRFSGKWSLFALIGTIPSGIWYLSVLPEPAKALVLGKSPTIVSMVQWGMGALLVLIAFTLIITLIRPAMNKGWVATIIMAAGLIYFGSFEWIREAARRPYAINEVIYSNMIMKDQVEMISTRGFIDTAKWVRTAELSQETKMQAGEELFIHQCYACHTIDGINNGIFETTAGMSYGALQAYIKKIHQVRYFMPPFVGTESEVDALAAFIAGGLHGKEIQTGRQHDSGTQLFESNCSACHEPSDLATSLEGEEKEEIIALLKTLDELSEEMVPFEGTDSEFESLSNYLFSLNNKRALEEHGPDGKELFEINCSACHAEEDMIEIVTHWSIDALRSALDQLETLSEEMVPYEGTAAEKDALSEYLHRLKGDS